MPKPTLWGIALSLAWTTAGAQSRDTTIVTAADYAFEAPASIRAGTHTFLMVNRGREMHMIVITRITGNHTTADLMKLIEKHAPAKWTKDVGGPNLVPPGDTANATLMMTPGRYVLTCFVPAADGTPHVMKGMFREITVRSNSRARYTSPKATSVIRLANYHIETPIAPRLGSNTFRVVNDGPLEHDVQIVKLIPGHSEAEALKWLETFSGPVTANVPAITMGGVTGFEKGDTGYFSVNLTRGDYLLLCWVPDDKGNPHFLRGMVHRFSLP